MRFNVQFLVAALFLAQDIAAAPLVGSSDARALAETGDFVERSAEPAVVLPRTTVKKTTAKKATAKKTTTAKKTAAKPATKKTTAAKKTTTAKKTTAAAKKTSTAPKKTTTTSKSSTAASCKKKRALTLTSTLGKRTTHFTKATAPSSIDIEIEGTKFALTKFTGNDDGNNGVVYRDSAGDFAKTPLSGTLAKEAAATKAVGQLKAHGTDTCTDTEWLISFAAKGANLQNTSAFRTAKAAGSAQCQELAEKAATLTVAKAKSIFDSTKINHGDLNAGNVFFDDAVTQVETLIDWGSASKKTSFPTLVATNQAKLSFKALC